MTANHQANLPTATEFQVWDKDKIREYIPHHDALKKYITINSDYEVQPSMIVLFDFSSEPIATKYKSVIFDTQAGIILTTKNSRQLFNSLSKNSTLGLKYQNKLREQLGLKRKHVFALGNYAYFSLNGFSQINTSWLALHQFSDFIQLAETEAQASTIQLNSTQYLFKFSSCAPQIQKRLHESITLNQELKQTAINFQRELGLNQTINNNLLTEEERLFKLQMANKPSLASLIKQVQNDDFEQYSFFMKSQTGMIWTKNDHQTGLSFTKRNNLMF
ncbi:hypothetical protein [Lactobacillus mulieris]|uniref:Uncharacterized protein n=2 Tax=Lactobacillus mulieris TaxID=2508708 RepID=A0AAW5WYS4_9LACO|nr:hypothetical protein [Lactobacillus mulieris]MCZ3621640.1 hypothetical protein [Lactobacillus mulieris]MCZ3623084.1 hypothetical protein [Lactobacillus mulieris]MCZ3635647.1 hypothetical protein [Lactobacillus mulieris]MCZ3740833.1 hypothetical protein [Lactobacillus mulieris]MCZ3744327.1 hypothetical protein [Lactobacillus mulieris]